MGSRKARGVVLEPRSVARTVQVAVAQCLAQVFGGDGFRCGQIGDAARHAQDAVIAARRQAEPVQRAAQQGLLGGAEPAVAVERGAVQLRIGAALPRQLALPRRAHACTHRGAGLAEIAAGAWTRCLFAMGARTA